MLPPPPSSTLFPYTTLFRSAAHRSWSRLHLTGHHYRCPRRPCPVPPKPRETRFRPRRKLLQTRGRCCGPATSATGLQKFPRSEEHTSELQSRFDLVCRLLLE